MPNQSQSYSQPEPNTEVTAKNNTKDWFYGTEELLDALPKLWTRSLLYGLVGFAVIALPWAILSKVDEIGSARGRIEPLSATHKLDSQTGGSVVAVKVKEGDTVKAGQILVELETDLLRTQQQQAQAKLSGQLNQKAQLQLLKNQVLLSIHTQSQQIQAQQTEKLAQVQQAKQNLDALKSTYNLQKEEKFAKLHQAQQAVDSSKSAYKLAQVRLHGAQEKAPRYKQVYEEGAIPQDRYLEVEQLVKENYQNVVQAQLDISRSQSSLSEQQSSFQRTQKQAQTDIQQAQLRLNEQLGSYQSLVHTGKLAVLKTQEQLKDLQGQITVLVSQLAQTKSEIESLNIQLQQKVITSPVDGVIFALPITKPGAVVQPGQLIASIAPKNTPVILKAQMPSQNSGFLKVGSRVKIKFDAYPFQDYGIVPGKVTWISPDSKVQENNQGKLETFELNIALSQPYIRSLSKSIPLTPGQTATAEVIIRQRRVIDYMLDPFKKLHTSGLEL